jgi:eukaryotic-like serine/threonine-protein kinase
VARTRTSGCWISLEERARFASSFTSISNVVWSPDGSRIIFNSNRDGPFNLYQEQVNGAKDGEVLLKSGEDKFPSSWSRDGRFLLYTVSDPKTKNDIWVLPLEGHKQPVPLLNTEFDEYNARFSPDGHWIAYASNESGRFEVYVRSFSMNSDGTVVKAGSKWQISDGSGVTPRWRDDGRELYYRSQAGNQSIMAVEIVTSPVFRAGSPKPLVPLSTQAIWDSASDGQRFLVSLPKSGKPEPYTVVLNWQASLKK